MANEKNLTETAIVAAEKGEVSWDFSNLEDALSTLTANDYMNAERACRAAGDKSPELTFTSHFRARLAAKALNMPYSEMRTINMKDFAAIVLRTATFLYESLEEVPALQKYSEN